uniref:Predicted protein n=1 Tax=Hordeum vulgare subsp. vulgare TaxID=112509 RepID=F2E5M3_HORVV|nr:predicted protein [Hordeum vulgare subsp. vulgare]
MLLIDLFLAIYSVQMVCKEQLQKMFF